MEAVTLFPSDVPPQKFAPFLARIPFCRKHGMSSASFYAWKDKYGGMDMADAQKLKGLEAENAKLKRLLADAMLDNRALKDLLEKMVTPAHRREAVAHLETAHEMSERRACRVTATRAPRAGGKRDNYNHHRPHATLGWLTPAAYSARWIEKRRA